jgi:hypothetical protein
MVVHFDAGDARLNSLMRRTPLRCATLSEYANSAGISIGAVIGAFGPYLDTGEAALEPLGGEIFLLTGLRRFSAGTDIPPNLWETLRSTAEPEVAARRWRLIRALERTGWRVNVDRAEIMAGLGHVRQPAAIGLNVGDIVFPLLDNVSLDDFQAGHGVLSDWAEAEAPVIGLTCPAGGLDRFVTAARLHFTRNRDRLQVVLVEEPAFNAVVLDSTDPRVVATEISRVFPVGKIERT